MALPKAKQKLMEQIKYRGTGTISDADAERYGPALSRIAEEHGGVAAPGDIVEAARAKDNPLHDWIYRLSDADAIKKHRLDQAVYLVGHIVEYVVDEASGEEVQLRPFVHVEEDDEATGYRERRTLTEGSYRERRVSEAFNDLASFVRRFADLPETAPVTKLIRKLLKLRGESDG